MWRWAEMNNIESFTSTSLFHGTVLKYWTDFTTYNLQVKKWILFCCDIFLRNTTLYSCKNITTIIANQWYETHELQCFHPYRNSIGQCSLSKVYSTYTRAGSTSIFRWLFVIILILPLIIICDNGQDCTQNPGR